MTKCIICERRPAKDTGFCAQCGQKFSSERKAKANGQPRHFLTYRGHVVGLFPNGNRTLRARLLMRKPESLPKGKTLNLNRWCEGYSREIIKSFKSCVLRLAHA